MSSIIEVRFDSSRNINFFISLLDKYIRSERNIKKREDGVMKILLDTFSLNFKKTYCLANGRPKYPSSMWVLDELLEPGFELHHNYDCDISYYEPQKPDFNDFIEIVNDLLNVTNGNFLMRRFEGNDEYLLRREHENTIYVNKKYHTPAFEKLTLPYELI